MYLQLSFLILYLSKVLISKHIMYLQLSYLLLRQVELANLQQGGFGARGRPRPCKPLTHNEEYYEVEDK